MLVLVLVLVLLVLVRVLVRVLLQRLLLASLVLPNLQTTFSTAPAEIMTQLLSVLRDGAGMKGREGGRIHRPIDRKRVGKGNGATQPRQAAHAPLLSTNG